MIEVTKRPYEWNFSGNPITYQLRSAFAQANSSVSFEVKIKYRHVQDAVFTELTSLPFYPYDGVVNVNIKDFIDAVVKHELPGFDPDEKTIWPSLKASCEFYICFREVIPNIPEQLWDESESEFIRYGVKGGIDYFVWRGANFWYNYYASKKIFFTWQKRGRLAYYEERMFLLYLHVLEADPADLVVICRYETIDGTTGKLETPLTSIPGLNKGLFFYIPSGASQWGIQAVIGQNKRLYWWEIQLEDRTDPANPLAVSEAFRYEQSFCNDYINIALHYRNSLGGLDSVRVRGVIDRELDYQYREQQVITGPDYFSGAFVEPQRTISGNTEILTWKGDIGHVEKEERERLRDMNLIREAWWERRRKWWPVIISTKNVKLSSSKDKLFSFPIEFSLANSGNAFFTPETEDLGDGFFSNNVCYAFPIGIMITVNTSGPAAVVTIDMDIEDPYGVGAQDLQYRIPGLVVNWTDVTNLPIILSSVTKGQTFVVQARAICPDGMPGRTVTAGFNTFGSGGATGDNYVILKSLVNTSVNYSLLVNGVNISTGDIAGNTELQVMQGFPDTQDATVDLVFNPVGNPPVLLAPSGATLTSNGLTYMWPDNGAFIRFEHVNIIGGFKIEFI